MGHLYLFISFSVSHQDTVSKITVLVETPVSGVTINCPTDMATFEPDVCTIDVMAGTDMEVTITYEGGGTNFSIAGN